LAVTTQFGKLFQRPTTLLVKYTCLACMLSPSQHSLFISYHPFSTNNIILVSMRVTFLWNQLADYGRPM